MFDSLRILCFVLTLASLMILEYYRPRIGIQRGRGKLLHYGTNALLLLANLGLLRLLFPLGLIGLALALSTGPAPVLQISQWLMLWVPSPTQVLLIETAVVVLIFDFVLWLQHLLFHRLDWLWRLHRIHHSDQTLDVSTGFRFHPGEVFLSFLLKSALVWLLAPSVFALTVWLIVFNLWTLFAHADIALPYSWERALRVIFITPDLHRVHHLHYRRFQDSNFGSIFSFWDKAFGVSCINDRQSLLATPVGLDNSEAATVPNSPTDT